MAFRTAIDGARTRYVPGLVLAELDYFLHDERDAMRVVVDNLSREAFTHAPADVDQLVRAMQIDREYTDLRLGLVDSSIPHHPVLTVDRDDFTVYRRNKRETIPTVFPPA